MLQKGISIYFGVAVLEDGSDYYDGIDDDGFIYIYILWRWEVVFGIFGTQKIQNAETFCTLLRNTNNEIVHVQAG